MIKKLVSFSWDDPPLEMEFRQGYFDLLREIGSSLEECLRFRQEVSLGEISEDRTIISQTVSSAANSLYLKTQAIINVALNYKICLEQGLPLHPTVYFDVNLDRLNLTTYSATEKEEAQNIFLKSISLARQIYSLTPNSLIELDAHITTLPTILLDFVYTHKKDKYTWNASDPELIRALAEKIRNGEQVPKLVVGAAHGSIQPGIVLAELLDAELYFVRCSRFKRKDKVPIISAQDESYLRGFAEKIVLVFDEDVARGETLRSLVERLRPHFRRTLSASVIKHYLAPFSPDFVGKENYD
ncbi:MAG TPA: phosphoribosyltransferase [Candidatus Nanoarchaeia archaeon]|nr:phosphoribosyltransferase [Candidatus Nanoarchaeia archaeon]